MVNLVPSFFPSKQFLPQEINLPMRSFAFNRALSPLLPSETLHGQRSPTRTKFFHVDAVHMMMIL